MSSGNHYHRPNRDGDKGSYRDNNDYRGGGGGGRDRYHDSDHHKRSRSKSRSRSRERKRTDTHTIERGHVSTAHSHTTRGFYEQESSGLSYNTRTVIEPSATIVIKGLPVHTTEQTLHMVLGPYYAKDIRLIPQRENKGCFAFVEFISLDYAVYFMTAFAGSAGDPQAAQLIIDTRSTAIEYARPLTFSPFDQSSHGHSNSHGQAPVARVIRSDWSCESCGCHNFAKRDHCFKCNLPRSTNPCTASYNDPFGDSTVSCDTPCMYLVIKGFVATLPTEENIAEYFRQYAAVKTVQILPDHSFTGGLAFVEFYSVDHAVYAKQCVTSQTEGLKVGFAREKVMHQLLKLHHHQQQQQAQVQQAAQQPQHMLAASAAAAASMAAMPQAAAQWQLPQLQPAYSGAASQPSLPLPLQQPVLFWPPLFESNGGAYIFQPKSGYFHEPVTDFYYSPRAKLYYSGKDGIYYRWESESFVRYDPPLPSSTEPCTAAAPLLGQAPAEQEQAQAHPLSSAAITSTTTGKMSISLTANKGSAASGGGGGGISLLGKKKATAVLKNIAKWGALQHDDDDDDTNQEATNDKNKKAKTENQPAAAPPPAKETEPSSQAQQQAVSSTASSKSAASAAASGSFVCLLCKRQFNSAEMLSRHEKESKLHAENLAKQEEKDKKQYHDRAKERRELFGSVADHLHRENEPKILTQIAVIPPPPPPPFPYPGPPQPPAAAAAATVAPVHADEHNPGNQIMRKLGWKEGTGLGRDSDGKEIAVGVELASAQQQSGTMQSTLRGTLGQSQGGAAGASAASSGGRSNYKESIQAAARARFEQVNNTNQK